VKFYNNLIIAALLMSSQTYAANEFFETGKEGWFYYKEAQKKKKEEEKEKQKKSDDQFMKSISINNLTSMQAKEFSETFTKAKEIATMNPTKENVQIVQMMNKWQTDQSEKFARVWTINMLENPNLEYPDIAKDKYGRSAQFHQKEKEMDEFFAKHKDDIGYVVFYSMQNEMAYKRQEIVFNALKNKYGTTIEYVNTDEQPDMIKKFKLATTPESFFVYKNSKGEAIWMRVKSGLATQEEIAKITMFLFENAIMEKDK
jgi:conjugal transfer pilus assembly protein TraF